MSQDQGTPDKPPQNAGATEQPTKGPSHVAYGVRETEKGDSYFNRVGAAFPHKDGEGFNINLDAFPTNGKIVLRTPKERLQEQREPDHHQSRQDRDTSR